MFMLRTNWNSVGRSIGRSEGSAPVNTFITSLAARRDMSLHTGAVGEETAGLGSLRKQKDGRAVLSQGPERQFEPGGRERRGEGSTTTPSELRLPAPRHQRTLKSTRIIDIQPQELVP